MNNDKIIPLLMVMTLAMGVARAEVAPATRPQGPPEPVVKLTLHPASTTRPALKYHLLREATEQTPGNAATLYLVAGTLGPHGKELPPLLDKVYEYLEVPLDRLPRKDAEQVLAPFAAQLREAHVAARRQEAHWDQSFRDEGANALLPYLNELRTVGNLWALQARVNIADKDWPAAMENIRDGMAVARHLNQEPMLIQGLVETGLADLTLERSVVDWVGQEGAPNLYWPLTDLPQPFIDLHAVAHWERATLYFTFPPLDATPIEQVTPRQWRQFMQQVPGLAESKEAIKDAPTFETQAAAAFIAARTYPQAKRYLLAAGMNPEAVDGMSVDQVVGIYFLRQYQTLSDEAWKAWELPYWQAAPQMQRAQEDEIAQKDLSPLAVFIPAIARARLQFARLDREIALLRTIEALRDYAARHEGQPPAALDEMKDLPLPIDPVTGRGFEYHRNGRTVILRAPPQPGGNPSEGKGYELTFVP